MEGAGIDGEKRRRLAAIIGLAALGLLLSCGGYMKLEGDITSVRVAETGGPKNVVVVEFEATNNAKVGYIVREARIAVTLDGEEVTGDTISAHDAKTLCQHLEALQAGCAEPLVTRETIASGQTVKRLVAASFDRAAADLEKRDALVLHVMELDRLETAFRERK